MLLWASLGLFPGQPRTPTPPAVGGLDPSLFASGPRPEGCLSEGWLIPQAPG